MNTLHANFNGGLMSPRIGARFDIEKLRTGCAQLQNFIPTLLGGIVKRPGIVVDDWLGNSSRSRAITFQRSVTDSNVIFLGEYWGKSRNTGTTRQVAWATAREYLVGDVVFDSGTFIYYYCGTKHTAGATFAGDSAYWTALTHLQSGTPLYVGTSTEFPTPWTAAQAFELKFDQANDVMFFTHPSYLPYRLSYRGDDYGRYVDGVLMAGGNWVIEPVPFEFAPALDLNETRIAVQVQYTGIRTWADSWVVATAYVDGQIIQGTGATAGRIYECILDHTSAAANQPGVGANTATYWTQLATGYSVGDRVTGITAPYEGQIFTCHTAHGGATADAVDEPGIGSAWATYWNLGTSSVTVSAWTAGTNYVAPNKVRISNVVYECTASHRATNATSARFGPTGGNKPAASQYWASFWKISSAGTGLSGLSFNLVSTEELFISTDVGTNWLLEIGTTGLYDSLALTGAINTAFGPTEPLFIQGAFTATTTWNAGVAMLGSLTIEESLDGVTWQKIKEWNQTSANDGNVSYEGEAPDIGAWYRISGNKGASGGTGGVFRIEASSAVIKMPFKIESYTSAKSVGGKLVTVNDQLPPASAIGVSTTSYRKPAFSPTEGYPRAVCFHDGRIWYGGTTGKGSRIWGSKLDDFYNFLTGSNDDAGLDFSLAAMEANEIIWMASHNRAMVAGTTGQEWTIDGGDSETVITPTKARARMRMKHGSADVAPQVIAESLLFFTRSQSQVREFTYSFQLDGYTAPDMTQLIGGLWSGSGIRCSAYTASPFPILWIVDVLGGLWAFIYDREQNVTAWTKFAVPTGDKFWSVAATRFDTLGFDYPVFTMQKEVNGTRHYVSAHLDYFSTTWYLTDSSSYMTDTNLNVYGTLDNGVVIAKSACTIASGNTTTPLQVTDNHLVGRSVVAFDGFTYSSAITYGASTNTFTGWTPASAASFIIVGELIEATVQAFPLDAMLQDGTGQGRKWRVNRAQLLLHRSKFGQYSDTPSGTFYDIQYDDTAIFSGRTDVHTGGDWGDTTQLTIRHNQPGPFCLLGYVLKGEVSGS